MQRLPEPELMDDPQQALAYAEADFSGSDQQLVDAIVAALADSGASPGCVLDLGCGPGNISFPLAAALAPTPLLAIDAAEAMLAIARRRQQRQPSRWPGLLFARARLPLARADLASLPPPFQPPYGLLVSNSLLHHLGDPAALWHSLRALAAPGAQVLIRDLRRPASRAELEVLVEQRGADLPPLVRRDFALSLAAAFEPAEVERQLAQAALEGLQVEERGELYLEVSGRLA